MNQKSYLSQRLSLLLVAACTSLFAFGQETPTGEVTDEHGIIITPAEGQTTLYERTGQGMFGEDYGDGMFLAYEDQDGTIEMVECSDGTIYFKDIISEYRRGYWVKGTKEGNTIHIPAYQVVAYSAEYDAAIVLRWAHGIGDGTIEADDTHADGFTFTIGDNGNIQIEGTSAFQMGAENYFMGMFWSDNAEFATYGDALTTWIPINVVTQVDELPYFNNFETMGDLQSFTIVDANDDSSTWFGYGGRYSHFGSYDLESDDWLISPAIKLEAGKNYHVGFDTWKNDDFSSKTIELKLGKAASPEALTQQAIAAFDVEGQMHQTLRNETLKVDETGYYYFGIHDISEAGGYSVFADNFFVKNGPADGAPAAISDLKVQQDGGEMRAIITFTTPTKAVDGSTLTTNLTKVEILRDGAVVKTIEDVALGSQQQVTDEGLSVGKYTYTAIAYNEQGFGQDGNVVSIFIAEAKEIPYTVSFADPSVLDEINIIDANGDGTTWAWNDYLDALSFSESYNADGDDYIVLMPIKAEAGHNYKVTFTGSTGYAAERFEVKAGREGTPEGLNLTVIAPTAFCSEEPTSFEGNFTAEADGLYYVAIHAISDMYNANLVACEITIEKGAEPTAPAACGLTVTAGEQGAKTAIITVTAPTKAVNGTDLTENLTRIELISDGKVIDTKEDVAPGAIIEMTAAVEKPDYYTYQVLAHNASGAGLLSEKVKTWIGQDLPGSFYGLQATDNGQNIDFSWTRVTEGQNGYYLNPDDVEYQILNAEFDGWSYAYTDIVGSVKGADHYTLDFNTDEGTQQLKTWGVKPVNEAGEGYPQSVTLLTGAPYTLPYQESAANGELASIWQVDGYGELYCINEASDGDGFGMALTTTWFTGEHFITSGKLALQDANNPTLHMDVKANGISKLQIKGAKLHEPAETIEEVTVGDEWTTVEIPLIGIKDARFSTLTFSAEFYNPTTTDWMTGEVQTWGDVVFFDNIRITDDGIDGIEQLTPSEASLPNNAFTLDGRRVNADANLKGLYIFKGKKTLIK